jgi:hypothetical protein
LLAPPFGSVGAEGGGRLARIRGNHTKESRIYSCNGLAVAAGTVPEPSTWAMLLIGFAGLGFAGYRGARKTSLAATAA